jgi:hypothetical protein
MGGTGSGRYLQRSKALTLGYSQINSLQWQREGWLKPGLLFECQAISPTIPGLGPGW